MKKQFSFKDAIESKIDDIIVAKNRANKIHRSADIRSSGDEVEILIRETISLFLPEKYLVKQGHIIDEFGNVSNQYDIIIFDRLSTPKFFEAKNDTVYYPINSVLAVGEIKKTLKYDHIENFSRSILHLKKIMNRVLVENTVFGGINPNSDMRDLLLFTTTQKYKNPLLSFIFAIDGDLESIPVANPVDVLACDVLILNSGYRYPATMINGKITPLTADDGTLIDELHDINGDSNNLFSRFLDRLLKHLNRCYIEPFSIEKYLTEGEELSVHSDNLKRRLI